MQDQDQAVNTLTLPRHLWARVHNLAKGLNITVETLPTGGMPEAPRALRMALEHMYERPFEFAETDPDYFDFMYNLLRGR